MRRLQEVATEAGQVEGAGASGVGGGKGWGDGLRFLCRRAAARTLCHSRCAGVMLLDGAGRHSPAAMTARLRSGGVRMDAALAAAALVVVATPMAVWLVGCDTAGAAGRAARRRVSRHPSWTTSTARSLGATGRTPGATGASSTARCRGRGRAITRCGCGAGCRATRASSLTRGATPTWATSRWRCGATARASRAL